MKRWIPGLFVWAALGLLLLAILTALLTHDPVASLTPADGVEFCARVLDHSRAWGEGRG